jgi:hypothetical protein
MQAAVLARVKRGLELHTLSLLGDKETMGSEMTSVSSQGMWLAGCVHQGSSLGRGHKARSEQGYGGE